MIKNTFKFIHISDTHLGIDQPTRTHKKREMQWKRADDFKENFHSVLNKAKEPDIDFLIHAGDLFNRSSPPESVIADTLQSIFELAKKKPVILLPGNHERAVLRTGFLDTITNLNVFHNARTIPLVINGIKVGITGFPFIRENFAKKYSKIIDKTCYFDQVFDYRILVMHQLLDSSFVGAQHYVFRKSDPNVLSLDKIDSKFNYLALGHIHTYQKIHGLEKKGIQAIYSGSIERTSFAERLEKKGFIEVEVTQTENDGFSQLKTQYKFIELPVRPMHLLNINIKDNLSMDELLKEMKSNLITFDKESLIYIRINGNIVDLSWEKLKNFCLDWKRKKLIRNFKLKLNEEFRNY